MKSVLLFLFTMIIGSYMAIGQYDPGTIESLGGGGGEREVAENGLIQLDIFTGAYILSADGAGSTAGTYSIDVLKPAGDNVSVHKAYLFGAPLWGSSNGCTQLNSVPIAWDGSSGTSWGCCNYYSDVTSIVAPIINAAGAGPTSIPIVDCGGMDGHALLVIFADPDLPNEKTIVIMFGGLSTLGDNFALTLSEPINPDAPGALLDMGIGISFGFQPSGQYTLIDINGARLTTSAGGYDDGEPDNGALMTVGGIGDVNTNPPDPFATDGGGTFYDDELYSLLDFIDNTTTNISVNTLNPSNNDNIFLAYFELSGAAIIGEGILLSQEEDVNPVGTNHTVQALVQDDLGDPVEGTLVDFTVISGPNAGANFSGPTDVDGHAFFTYNGSGGPGFDEIEACFTNSAGAYVCSNILVKHWIGEVPPIPVSNWALMIGILMIIVVAVIRFRR